MKIRILGDEVLRTVATPVEKFDKKLRYLVDDMFETMYDAEGIGLAAPQVGESIRLLVVDVSDIEEDKEPTAFINPEIIDSTGSSTVEEGCLSIPGAREEVTRPERIRVKYNDVDGKQFEEEFSGWMARVLQHEIDHLDGVLFIDYLSPVKQKIIESKFE